MWAYSFKAEAESIRSNIAIIAGIVISLGAIVAPFAPFIRRYLKTRRSRRDAALATSIANVMRPEIDAIRAAARQQHDEQNSKIADGFRSIDERFDELGDRLNVGAEHLARHDIEIAVLQARDPNSRSRKDDHGHAS